MVLTAPKLIQSEYGEHQHSQLLSWVSQGIPDLEKLDKFFIENDKDRRYDIPALINDLNNKRIINVMQRWSQLVNQQNVVAVVLEEMTVEDCKPN